MVVRGDSIGATMSHYLAEQIGKTANIRLRPRTEIACVEGNGHVERVGLKPADSEAVVMEEADAVFVFIGTRPRSEWLPEGVLRNAKGFVLTGLELTSAEAFRRVWKERRDPLPLETSVPGIFAAGDICAGAMNRVASAVGAGSMVATSVYAYLAIT
jgi:thioredoxin reductase (NADPH)